MKKRRWLLLVFVMGCAGIQRDCSSCNAENFGSDWVVVQYNYVGAPINCWKLKGVGIANEDKSDGIYWTDSSSGHLVHISGWYNRVQVVGAKYETAAAAIGVDLDRCVNGRYAEATTQP